jgi:hypothetical protein
MAHPTAQDRRTFLTTMSMLGVPVALPASLRAAPPHEPGHFPHNDPARVQSVVGASHANFAVVSQLVTEQPALAKASWDWGFGDWETALGAASHTGRREIAHFLIENGAHPTVFSAAMLGDVDTVRAHLTADPSLYRLPGPHGITLLAHARVGGADAERVVDFLTDRFGPDEPPAHVAADADVEARYLGRFRFDTDPPTEIGVAVRNGFLLVGAGEQPNSRVVRVEEHVFHPTGAPGVRLRFDMVDGRANTLTVVDGPLTLTGARLA